MTFHYSTTSAKCKIDGSNSAFARLSAGEIYSAMSPMGDDPEDILDEMADMGDDTAFLRDLEQREQIKRRLDDLGDEIDRLNSQLHVEYNEQQFEELRQLRFQRREMKFQQLEIEARLEDHKNKMASLAVRLTDEQMYSGEHDAEFIGKARKDATFEDGSVEWLNHRQTGIGGSDFYNIALGTRSEKRDAAIDKLREFGPEDAQDKHDHTGAIGRGNAYENVVVHDFIRRSVEITGEELEVVLNKSTYRGEHEWQLANFDGLIRRPGEEEPEGVFEAKTSSRPEDWEDGSMPMGYYTQVVHYLNTTGLEYGYIGVCFDGRVQDIQYRKVYRDGTIYADDDHYNDYIPEMQDFWDNRHRYAEYRPRPQKYRFADSESDLRTLAAYRGESVQETARALVALNGKPDDDYQHLYATSPRKGIRVHVDLETTSDEVIEFGAVVEDEQGNVIDSYSELFSADKRYVAMNGTGFEDVHGITPEMIEGRRSIREAVPDIRRVLRMDTGEPVTMVAHNASFETRYLDQEIDGFRSAREGDNPQIRILDTMRVSQKAVHSSADNRLQSFVEHFGFEYENAHRAHEDANMMRNALNAFTERIRQFGRRL